MIAVMWLWVTHRVRRRPAGQTAQAPASGEILCDYPIVVPMLIAFTVILAVLLLAGHHG